MSNRTDTRRSARSRSRRSAATSSRPSSIETIRSSSSWPSTAGRTTRSGSPGSLHFDTPDELYAALTPDDDIVVYCSQVDCLSSVALYRDLVKRGYRHVRRYAGGFARLGGGRAAARGCVRGVTRVTARGMPGEASAAIRRRRPGRRDGPSRRRLGTHALVRAHRARPSPQSRRMPGTRLLRGPRLVGPRPDRPRRDLARPGRGPAHAHQRRHAMRAMRSTSMR